MYDKSYTTRNRLWISLRARFEFFFYYGTNEDVVNDTAFSFKSVLSVIKAPISDNSVIRYIPYNTKMSLHNFSNIQVFHLRANSF